MKLLRNLLTAIFASLLVGGIAPIAGAETGTAQLMGDRLRVGQLKELRTDLSARLAQAHADDQIRFALGATEFLLAVEHLSQSMYRYGLEPPPSFARELPFFRIPVPHNPKPDQLSYKKMRDVFMAVQAEFSAADATLSEIGTGDVKLPIAIGLARLDLNGDGLSSQTKCNTGYTRCCNGTKIFTALSGGGLFDCPVAFHGAIDPENRSSFGSLGIDHFSRSKAQWREKGGLQALLCRRAGQGAALARFASGAPAGPAKARPRPPCNGMVARPNCWPAGA